MRYKKISARRLSDLRGPRRKKPPIQQQNRDLRDALLREHDLLQSLIRDAKLRRAIWLGSGRMLEPLVVWTDFDRTYRDTEIDPNQLSKWTELTEYMKLQAGFLVAMEFGGYSFTCNLPTDLETRWKGAGTSIPHMIQKRLRQQLERTGLADLPYAYVIEGRSRSGRSRTHVHVHGYLIAEDPLIATRFKVVLERALLMDRGRRLGTSTAIDIVPVYDVDTGDGRGYGRWIGYASKNASRWDARLRGRRVFISRPLTQIVREFWELLRTDPITP